MMLKTREYELKSQFSLSIGDRIGCKIDLPNSAIPWIATGKNASKAATTTVVIENT